MTTYRHRRITHFARVCLQTVAPTTHPRAAVNTQRAKGTPNLRPNRPLARASQAQTATKVVALVVVVTDSTLQRTSVGSTLHAGADGPQAPLVSQLLGNAAQTLGLAKYASKPAIALASPAQGNRT